MNSKITKITSNRCIKLPPIGNTKKPNNHNTINRQSKISNILQYN